jgi:hypothetical protein
METGGRVERAAVRRGRLGKSAPLLKYPDAPPDLVTFLERYIIVGKGFRRILYEDCFY